MDLQALLQEMTLDEKLAQMSQFVTSYIAWDPNSDVTGPHAELHLTEQHLAALGSCLGGHLSPDEMIKLQDKHMAQDPHHIPLLFMLDVIHGYRTLYPIPLGMGATWDEKLVADCCAMAAKEASVSGVQVTFSPMADLTRDCRWGRNMEGTGEDAWLNGRMAAAMVKGYQGDGKGKYHLASCVKHFAAYGAAEAGRDYNTTDMSEHTLREFYLPAYRAAVDAGARMVMTAFNALNGTPGTANRRLFADILRGEWGFDGTVISDWGALREMCVHGLVENEKEAAERAILAGTDIEMSTACYIHHIPELIAEGKVSMEAVDTATMRILKLKEELGLFENPYASISAEDAARFCLCREHRALACRAAETAAVLLKNDGILPFSEAVQTIAVIGPYADTAMLGSWSCRGEVADAVSVADGIRHLLPRATLSVAAGCSPALHAKPDERLTQEAVELAKRSDIVILCMGEQSEMSGEGNSRADVGLSEAQKQLIRAITAVQPKTAVLLFNGRPLALGDIIDAMPAAVTMWQPGTEGGTAAANLLFGRTNFSGHLTMSFPWHVGQAPIYYNHMRTGRPKPSEDSTVGYVSRYIDYPNRPLFPFGYGLSYTTFAYGKPVLNAETMRAGETMIASVTVRNTGNRTGDTVVQLYIRDCVASLVRPVRELRGYQKITLAPGAAQTVSFEIDTQMLAFHTADGTVRAEPGKFEVWLSADAESGEACSFVLQ